MASDFFCPDLLVEVMGLEPHDFYVAKVAPMLMMGVEHRLPTARRCQVLPIRHAVETGCDGPAPNAVLCDDELALHDSVDAWAAEIAKGWNVFGEVALTADRSHQRRPHSRPDV